MLSVIGGIFLVMGLGLLPMVAYALVLWWLDRYEKEPVGLLLIAFLWGAAPAALFSFVTQVVFDLSIQYFVEPTAANIIGGVLVAPLTEEIFKGLALVLLLLFYRKEIDSPLDGIIYGGLVGFGFAAVENVLYFADAFAMGGAGGVISLAFLRALIFGMNHALFTALTGLGLALMWTSPRPLVRWVAPVAGFLSAMTAHGTHNLTVAFGELVWPCLLTFVSDWGGLLLLLAVIVWTILRERSWIVEFLADEVERGTLSRTHYQTVCSAFGRWVEGVNALAQGDVRRMFELSRYYRLATELAFNKRRVTHFPQEKEARRRVAQLRQEVALLSERL